MNVISARAIVFASALLVAACGTTTLPWYEYSERAHTRNIINKMYERGGSVSVAVLPSKPVSDGQPYALFGTLQEAVDAAQSGDTVLLLRDAGINNILLNDKSLTIAGSNIGRIYGASEAPAEGNIFKLTRGGSGRGSNNVTLSVGRYITVGRNASLTLIGLALQGGRSYFQLNSMGRLTIEDCSLEDLEANFNRGDVRIARTQVRTDSILSFVDVNVQMQKVELTRKTDETTHRARIFVDSADSRFEDCTLGIALLWVTSSKIAIEGGDFGRLVAQSSKIALDGSNVGSVEAWSSTAVTYAKLRSNATNWAIYADASSTIEGDNSVKLSTEEIRREQKEQERREEEAAERRRREREENERQRAQAERERIASRNADYGKRLGAEWQKALRMGLSYFVGNWSAIYNPPQSDIGWTVSMSLRPHQYWRGSYQWDYIISWDRYRDWYDEVHHTVDGMQYEYNENGDGIIKFKSGDKIHYYPIIAYVPDSGGWIVLSNVVSIPTRAKLQRRSR